MFIIIIIIIIIISSSSSSSRLVRAIPLTADGAARERRAVDLAAWP